MCEAEHPHRIKLFRFSVNDQSFTEAGVFESRTGDVNMGSSVVTKLKEIRFFSVRIFAGKVVKFAHWSIVSGFNVDQRFVVLQELAK